MRTGRCLCGAVAYELTEEPAMLAFCNCRNCQYVTAGEPSAVAITPKSGFQLRQGTLKTFWTRADSGAMADRNFCPECGSQIVSRLHAESPFVAVMAGTLDEPLPLAPQLEIWASVAQPWAHHPEGAAQFPGNPPG